MRRKFSWTKHQLDKLNKVHKILDEFADYKPLTLRQVYYQLVGKGYIDNTRSQYGMLSNLLKWARIEGHISWDDIEDRIRTFHNKEGWTNRQEFFKKRLGAFLDAYERDLWQDQDKYVEVWIEKDALSSIFTQVCSRYNVSVVVCRGFSSVSFQYEYKIRLDQHSGRKGVMLYFGDFDPSGMEMLESMIITLKDELGAPPLDFKRIALLKDDIFEHKLPHDYKALKKSDTRAQKHVERYGELAVELDALRPDVLEQKIKEAVLAELTDLEAYNDQVGAYNSEIQDMEGLADRMLEII